MTEDKSADFNNFLEQLINATARIEKHYFQQPVTGSKNLIIRERVYCYELYHQLRYSQENQKYYTDGELDKRGHPFIKGNRKPDFVVHVPGNMKNNLAVIEVKPINAQFNRIEDDLKKLKGFLEKEYYGAIMLVYGNSPKGEDKIRRIRSKIDSLSKHSECILLLWHKEPGKPAEVIKNARTA